MLGNLFFPFCFLEEKKTSSNKLLELQTEADYSSLYSDLHLFSYTAHFNFFFFLRAKATLVVQKVKVFALLAAGLSVLQGKL